MSARTKKALLFVTKKWIALARHTFDRVCNAFLYSRKYRINANLFEIATLFY